MESIETYCFFLKFLLKKLLISITNCGRIDMCNHRHCGYKKYQSMAGDLFFGKKKEYPRVMTKIVTKAWNAFTTLLVTAVVILAVLLAGVRLVGFQVYTVLSGSMEPAYPTGSLIYVREVDHQDLAEGDVITFMLNEDTVATHRIAGVVPDENDPSVIRYRTKGDANNAEDGTLVHYKNVLGSPVFTIPYLGYAANYIQSPPGMYVAISGGAVILLLVFLPDLFGSKGEKPRKAKGGKYLRK